MIQQTDATPMWTRRGPYVFEWADVGRACERLRASVLADGFAPTVVYGVARGGLVTAAYLYSALEVPRLVSVRARRTVSDERYAAKQTPVVESSVELDPEDRVLVVDDIAGTGVTAEAVSRKLVGVAEHRFAVLARNHLCPVPIHYCGFTADDWVVFPWERGYRKRPSDWRQIPWTEEQ
ncbi:putative phosphoribosyltransferase [Frankia casuarinae]|jgi:hypoxanthine phosphoribosyltransferase|uniref:Phosphoribosyltransferase n=1 Tax=Frankia casuarinae (strain DSM 45818 / CECT 9043 / HFP020203 / CcI3) TaxID=106370 RepID=Q2JC65_FRACC|nr:phosphoribosyltransferase family protein [Frankia casuarinae]ABD11127.1 phosphoribosyltransferase [Frankia casuarinae]EYT90898.1 putative phosphoribosyltransferase [Frankia casuarinae]